MKYIYYIKNKVNSKIYIGQTENFQNRMKQHFIYLQSWGNELHKDIEDLGKDNFEFGILEECPDELISIKEKYWILFYKQQEIDLYNNSLGGEGNRITYNISDEKIIDTYKKEQSVTYTAKILNISYKYCLKILKKHNQKIFSSQEVNKNKQGQKIKQLDKNSENCIKVFSSIKEATKEVNGYSRNIWRAINGQRKTAYGYKWIKA